jgi:phenol 2-monooxygenase
LLTKSPEHVWGVLDIRPDTDFPDIRHINVINARDSRCMIIPREKNLIRFYVQLDDMVGEKATVSKDDFTWEQIFAVGQAALRPFRIETKEAPEWWSVYKSESFLP